jgi:hypothetical protein
VTGVNLPWATSPCQDEAAKVLALAQTPAWKGSDTARRRIKRAHHRGNPPKAGAEELAVIGRVPDRV